MNDNFELENPDPMIFIVIGEVRQDAQTEPVPFNALLAAPDDDTAVRLVLDSLAQEGFAEADLHQIGNIEGEPQEDQFVEAYASACQGEIALILFDGQNDESEEAGTIH